MSYAAYLGDAARVKALLDAGAAVDSRDLRGWTPLFFALQGATCEYRDSYHQMNPFP